VRAGAGRPARRGGASSPQAQLSPPTLRAVAAIEGDESAALRLELLGARRSVEDLERALLSSRAIGVAMGILMERHQLSTEQAFEQLVTSSQRRNIKLREVADELVRTGSWGNVRSLLDGRARPTV